MQHLKLLLVFLLFIIATNSFAQIPRYRGLWWNDATSEDYYVSIDPGTSTRTMIKSIPGVEYIYDVGIFNPDSNRYVFIGGNDNSGTFEFFYYVLNGQTGDVISTSPYNSVANIQYNPLTKTYMGLWYNQTSLSFDVVKINPYTSAIAFMNNLPDVEGVSEISVFDTDSNRYLFVGGNDNSGTFVSYYYVLDAISGLKISTSPDLGVHSIEYNPFSKQYVGVWWNEPTQEEYFVSLNPKNSSKTLIKSIPGVEFVSEVSVFNTDSNRYVLLAGNDNSGAMVFSNYVLDGQTGDVIATSPYNLVRGISYINNFTVGVDQQTMVKDEISIYPNPALETVNIELPEIAAPYQIQFFNTLGQKIIDKENNLERITSVDIKDLSSGIYSILIKMNEEVISRKFVKE